MKDSGIEKIIPNRYSANNEIKQMINNKETKKLDIIGVSLRDFLTPYSAFNELWKTIITRLENEEKSSLIESERLTVRLMLLDQKSPEGIFRHNTEKNTTTLDLMEDVPRAINEINFKIESIYGTRERKFLRVKVYEHCTFGFMISSERELYIEQYCYKNHSLPGMLPLIKYNKKSTQFKQLRHSILTIWKYAHQPKFNHELGTANGINHSKITNIYTKDEKESLSARQKHVLSTLVCDQERNNQVKIIAISGRFYLTNPILKILREKSSKKSKNSIPIKIAIINPVSQQSILRAIADANSLDKLAGTLKKYSWRNHKNSKLFSDIDKAINELETWDIKENYTIDIRLYSGAIACSLLLAGGTAFVEQYIYGRSDENQKHRILGGEYPLFEYDISVKNIYKEMFESTFDTLWNGYSISLDEFKALDKESIFNSNLDILNKELIYKE